MVARVRGIEFEKEKGGYLVPVNMGAGQALSDVSHWLGFHHDYDYLDTLSIERSRIFDRATY
jgi:hypothetical protein